MEAPTPAINYSESIASLVKQLPEERAAQLYAFARFLLDETHQTVDAIAVDDEEEVSDAELAAEDAQWEDALARHADTFAALKAQALVDIAAGNTIPMFDERGEFNIK